LWGLAVSIHERLSSLKIQRRYLGDRWKALTPPARTGADWGLRLPSRIHCALFDFAFPALAKNRWTPGANGTYGTYFKQISDVDLDRVRTFVEGLRPLVIVEDLTEASIALAFRARTGETGGVEPTELGQLMRDAKPYDETPSVQHQKAGTELAGRLCSFFESMPLYEGVNGFVAVPSSNPAKAFSLPRGFAAELARRTGKADLSSAVKKSKATPQMKNLSKAQKVEALLGSVAVDSAMVVGKTIVVVDDLYQSGLTLNYVAEELRAAGAAAIFGLAVVKTLRDDDNVPRPAGDPSCAPSAQVDDDDEDDEILF
jgi:hypothetical protein